MPRQPTQADLDRLRRFRAQPEFDLSCRETLARIGQQLQRQHRHVGGLGTLWAELLPKDLLDRTRVLGLWRGILKVQCDDSATLHQVDLWLREGGQTALIRQAPTGLSRVKLTL
jgi:hypothetical protein